MGRLTVARAHGLFNSVGGLWPLLHIRSFEAVLGPKTDRWLVRTVAGLMLTNGALQFAARSPNDLVTARRLGVGTAATLAAIDLAYAPSGRISRIYLVDAVVECGWLVAWAAGDGRRMR